MVNKKIILGTVQFGLPYGINNKDGKPQEEKIFEILKVAYTKGIRLLDTAEIYGNASDVIGRFHKKTNIQFDVISKFKNTDDFLVDYWVEKQLIRLDCGSLYACMFHTYEDYLGNPKAVKQLINMQSMGLIQKIGVSAYSNKQFEDVLSDSTIQLIQLPFNLLDNENQRGSLMTLAKTKNVEIHTRSVFLQGLFFMNPENVPEKLKPLQRELNCLHDVSKNYNIPINQIALNYVIFNKKIDNIIIGVDSIEQLESNLEIINKPLPKEIIDIINRIKVINTELLNPSNW